MGEVSRSGDLLRLSDQIYATLRRRILLGELEQGTRLTEQRLSEDLAVSRVPLREAMPRLERSGFVRSLPRRGAVVTEWSSRLIHELFDVRLALEPAAARMAARRASAGEDLNSLIHAREDSEDELTHGDPLRVASANAAFHQGLVDAAGNDLMSDLMRATAGRMTWLFYLTRQRDARVARDEHREITDVIRSGNERLAEAVIYTHIEAGRVPSLEALRDAAGDTAG